MKRTLSLENKTIAIDVLTSELPELKNIKVSKANAIGVWLCDKIKNMLKSGVICAGQKLPLKSEFAYRLGVSIGTVQNALKYVEDMGYLEAKPCVGTLIKDKHSPLSLNKKSISKRDIITLDIKKYIKSQGFKKGDDIGASNKIALILKRPANTVRLALENLCNQGILTHNFRKADEKTGWYLAVDKFNIEELELNNETLVDRAVKAIEEYIIEHHQVGDRTETHNEFAKLLNMSISTIHSAFQTLIDRGILIPRRGQYGTYILKMPNEAGKQNMSKETSIFAPASDAVVYYYEKIQTQLKKLISDNYTVGEKLPAIPQIAQKLDISPNTVRKALNKLADDGYVQLQRGRYGGTFVTEIPSETSQNFKWLAVNPKYAKVGKN